MTTNHRDTVAALRRAAYGVGTWRYGDDSSEHLPSDQLFWICACTDGWEWNTEDGAVCDVAFSARGCGMLRPPMSEQPR